MTATVKHTPDFFIGQKVVCIVAAKKKRKGRVLDGKQLIGHAADANYPVKGGTYTVRFINVIPVGVDGDSETLLLLEEVRNDHLTDFIRGGLEPGFRASAFEAAS